MSLVLLVIHIRRLVTGTAMTMAYHEARHIIKKHVNANESDVNY